MKHKLFMNFEHTMNDWNVTTFDLEHDNVAHSYGRLAIMCEHQQIASMKSGLHAATEMKRTRIK